MKSGPDLDEIVLFPRSDLHMAQIKTIFNSIP